MEEIIEIEKSPMVIEIEKIMSEMPERHLDKSSFLWTDDDITSLRYDREQFLVVEGGFFHPDDYAILHNMYERWNGND